MINIYEILKNCGVEIPQDKKTDFDKAKAIKSTYDDLTAKVPGLYDHSERMRTYFKGANPLTSGGSGGIIRDTSKSIGSIFTGSVYNPEDIQKAMVQKGTNFVTKDNKNDEYMYGLAVEKCFKNVDGLYDIKAHGDYDGVKIFDTAVDANELAKIILMRSDYKGEPIRLLSCNTGRMVNGTCVAQELADLLNVEVQAPDDFLIVSEKGWWNIGTDRFEIKREFRVFTPQKIQKNI